MKTIVQELAKQDQVVRLLTKILQTIKENKATIKENNLRLGRLEALYKKLAKRNRGM